MPELRVLIGLPASGKSTYALTLENYTPGQEQWRRINWDEERVVRGMTVKFNREEEDRMQKDLFGQAEYWGKQGFNVVVDNTNLSERTRNKWRAVAQRAGMTYVEERMEASPEECIRRDAKREGRACVGRPVIERMALFADMIDWGKPFARFVIVDMDGTLADCSARRKFIADGRHDWENFEAHSFEDEPIWPIINLVAVLEQAGFRILIVSGRHIDKTGKDTVAWLEKYGIHYDHIFMRQSGDNRPDDIIKQEILDKLPKDRISYVLDDRNQVVDMWRANGLTCLQVAPGDF